MTSPEPSRRNGAYVDVDGVVTYFEVTGGGEALILLHGGMGTAEECDAQATKLAETFRVYVPERYGQGRTPDIAGDITYENMAEHTIGFMETLGIESAHLVGWSDGALIGLLVALRRPELVRKLVLIDQFISLDGARPAVQEEIASMTLDDMSAESVAVYKALSPDGPDHFPVVFDKIHKLWTDETGLDLADLEQVAAPTLLLVADGGVMTLDHATAMAETLDDSLLVVVPGTTHNLPHEKPDIVNEYILDFLADHPASAGVRRRRAVGAGAGALHFVLLSRNQNPTGDTSYTMVMGSNDQDAQRTDWAAAGFILTALSVGALGWVWLTYTEAYGAVGVQPEEVGLDPLRILSVALTAILALAAFVGLPLSIAFVLWPEKLGWPQAAGVFALVTLWGLLHLAPSETFCGLVAIGLLGLIVPLFPLGERLGENADKAGRRLSVAMSALVLIIGSVVTANAGDAVRELGNADGRSSFAGVVLRVPAPVVCVTPSPSISAPTDRPLRLLGTANDVHVLLEGTRVWRIPSTATTLGPVLGRACPGS